MVSQHPSVVSSINFRQSESLSKVPASVPWRHYSELEDIGMPFVRGVRAAVIRTRAEQI
jgi:hypothetical protein